jgi:hypothetical protein
MKLKINNFNIDTFKKKLNHLNDIDFSLFVDDIPKSSEDLSPINIVVLQEPNEYFGLHDWVIENKNLFSFILTWDDKVINNCENAVFLPFGHTWFKKDQYEKNQEKKFQISHLRGNLLKTYGHSLRHELLNRENEIQIPKKFFASYGDRYNIEEARKGKEEVFGDSMYGVAIENTSHNGYFTEKILDCFLLKTIPVYWGCSSIFNFFRQEGIIIFSNIDDLIVKVNKLTEDYYYDNLEAIEANYNLALQYVDYEQNIINNITEIFKLNKIIS